MEHAVGVFGFLNVESRTVFSALVEEEFDDHFCGRCFCVDDHRANRGYRVVDAEAQFVRVGWLRVPVLRKGL